MSDGDGRTPRTSMSVESRTPRASVDERAARSSISIARKSLSGDGPPFNVYVLKGDGAGKGSINTSGKTIEWSDIRSRSLTGSLA